MCLVGGTRVCKTYWSSPASSSRRKRDCRKENAIDYDVYWIQQSRYSIVYGATSNKQRYLTYTVKFQLTGERFSARSWLPNKKTGHGNRITCFMAELNSYLSVNISLALYFCRTSKFSSLLPRSEACLHLWLGLFCLYLSCHKYKNHHQWAKNIQLTLQRRGRTGQFYILPKATVDIKPYVQFIRCLIRVALVDKRSINQSHKCKWYHLSIQTSLFK